MSISYDKDGFKLSITAGVADEAKGKRRWTNVAASYLGWLCDDLESLATLKAWIDSFRRGHITNREVSVVMGTEQDGIGGAVRQKDQVQYLLLRRLGQGQEKVERHLSYLEATRLEFVVLKALQALGPTIVWGVEGGSSKSPGTVNETASSLPRER